MKRLSLVTPDLYGSHGGIARIARVLARAMSELAEARGASLVIHSLHDKLDARAEVTASYHPYAGSRVAFARGVLASVHDRATCATVYTHVNHAPLHQLARAPYFVVAHGVDVWSPLSLMRTRGLQQARAVWAVSDYTNRVVRGLHHAPNTKTIHNCLALDAQPSSQVQDSKSILLVSRLAGTREGKRIDDAIRAFAHARNQFGLNDWTLDIVGDGPLRQTYEALARKERVQGSVRFHRGVSDEELKRLYRDCAFFSLPSVNEGFGLVFLEAMSYGKAVIAACAGAAPEVVRDGITGLVLAPGDIEGLAAAYTRLAHDVALRNALGEAGHADVTSRFGYPAYRAAIHAELSPCL